MSSFLALWNMNEEPADVEIISRMLSAAAYKKADGQDVWINETVALAHKHFWVLPEEQSRSQPVVHPESGCVITCSARLDNRGDLIRTLDLPASFIQFSDAELILHAYLRWGKDCVIHLLGDFAFVIWDSTQRLMFAARDALGCEELVYAVDEKVCVFATSISMLLAHPHIKPELNERKLAEYLILDASDESATFYKAIYHLPPAHCMVVSQSGSKQWRYWQINPLNTTQKPDPHEAADQYRKLIKQAINDRLRTEYPVGISLSGGLDSSSLALLVVECLSENGRGKSAELSSYSYIFDSFPDCDERQDIIAVVERANNKYPVKQHFFNGDNAWPAPFSEDWQVSRDYPYLDPFIVLLKAILRSASDNGTRLLISGFYGDDLYSGENYWLADMLFERRFVEAAEIVRRHSNSVELKRDAWDYGLKTLAPEKVKQTYHSLQGSKPLWSGFLTAEFASKTNIFNHREGRTSESKLHSPGKQKRYHALFHLGYSEDISVYQSLARQFNIQYSYPFMDRRIVEFLFSLPTDMIGLPFCTRRILRNAMRNDLPDSIRLLSSKASLSGLFDYGVYDQNDRLIQKNLSGSQLVQRGYIEKAWIDQHFLQSPSEYESLLLWNCITATNWLEKYW